MHVCNQHLVMDLPWLVCFTEKLLQACFDEVSIGNWKLTEKVNHVVYLFIYFVGQPVH